MKTGPLLCSEGGNSNHYVLIAKHFKSSDDFNKKTLFERVTGNFYTPFTIGNQLVLKASEWISKHNSGDSISIIDPFCGDGRLIVWFLEHLKEKEPNIDSYKYNVAIWDSNKSAVDIAIKSIDSLASTNKLDILISPFIGDTFLHFFETNERFNVVLTNPPWVVLKPDKRETKHLSESKYNDYINSLRIYANQINFLYPRSKPKKRWSGWGTNLSRMGVEVATRLMSKDGVAGIVSPVSLLADGNSKELREWLFLKKHCTNIYYYPAECRLFKYVDQPSISMVLTNSSAVKECTITTFHKNLKMKNIVKIVIDSDFFKQMGSVIPVNLNHKQIDIFRTFSNLNPLFQLEGKRPGEAWIGRELDETGYAKKIVTDGNIPFVKGRSIHRLDAHFDVIGMMSHKTVGKKISSIDYPRIVWRDVSRPTQKRRIQATLLPPGYLTGNSLGVLHFNENDMKNSLTYLGVLSSLVFEFQIRAMLATGHISAGTIKNARIPRLSEKTKKKLSSLTKKALRKDRKAEIELEAYVANLYGLNQKQFEIILESFPKINKKERDDLLDNHIWDRIGDLNFER